MKKDYLDSILEPVEQDALARFVQDDTMFEAVRKVLLAGLYENGTLKKGKKANPLFNSAFGLVSLRGNYKNEQLGEDLRALWEGVNALEAGLSSLKKYLPDTQERSETKNPAL